MEQNKESLDIIPESQAARWAFHLAIIPVFGFFLYMFAAFLGLYQIGKGRTGFFWLSKGFWRMLRMTGAGVIGFAACWFCPFYDYRDFPTRYTDKVSARIMLEEVGETWGFSGQIAYAKGYSIRSLEYPAKLLKMWTWILYDGEGTKIAELPFWFDKKNGVYKQWDRNGKLIVQGKYINDKQEGKWLSRYSNGNQERECFFNNGHKCGAYTLWHSNSIKAQEGVYNGDISIGEEWKSEKRMGAWRFWDESGNLTMEETYDDNGNIKKSVEYKDGKQVKTTLYKDGQPIGENPKPQ
jgi:antitoxin component YwqK of YwqJK toxin-antitoxin module